MANSLVLIEADAHDAVHEALDALPDEGAEDAWELVEYAEGVSKAVEELERAAEGGSSVATDSESNVGAIPNDLAEYRFLPEDFEISAESVVADAERALDVTETEFEFEVELETDEGGTNMLRSSVLLTDAPWYHEDGEHGLDTHVACPVCDYYPLNAEYEAASDESLRFQLRCPWDMCRGNLRDSWSSKQYTGDEAIAARRLFERSRR